MSVAAAHMPASSPGRALMECDHLSSPRSNTARENDESAVGNFPLTLKCVLKTRIGKKEASTLTVGQVNALLDKLMCVRLTAYD